MSANKNPEKKVVTDSMGDLEIDFNALYGAQTKRAIDNFPVSGQRMPKEFISALITIKQVAAEANGKLNCISENISTSIQEACESLLHQEDFMNHFPVDVFQTGSGTSSNMNANEVIATIASKNGADGVNANDHVNFGQSSNDVIPTAIHVSASLTTRTNLIASLNHLVSSIEEKIPEVTNYCKTGRTHLMDAMPIRLEQSLQGWADQLKQNIRLLEQLLPSVQTLAIGGTAVGTGINTHPSFASEFVKILSKKTGQNFKKAENFFPLMGSQDTIVALSGQLKTLAVTIMKIANDLRWMNSGPLAGLGEITLEALQPGSSIMPGKVNPVIPEASAMVAAEVIGNDAAITIAGQSGNFELNVMLPLVGAKIIGSISLLSNVSVLLANKAIKTFTVNEANLNAALHKNPILVTALNPIIGYAKAAEIAKKAYKENKPIIQVATEETDIGEEELKELLNPMKLTKGGL